MRPPSLLHFGKIAFVGLFQIHAFSMLHVFMCYGYLDFKMFDYCRNIWWKKEYSQWLGFGGFATNFIEGTNTRV